MTEPVHPICHRTLHATFTNHELARMASVGEPVSERPELQPFLRWIAGKPADFHAPTKRRR